MTAKDGIREQIRAAFFDNLGLKALSVGIAIVFLAVAVPIAENLSTRSCAGL